MVGGKGDLREIRQKTSSKHRKGGDDDLPVNTNAMATKAAFRIVRLILLRST